MSAWIGHCHGDTLWLLIVSIVKKKGEIEQFFFVFLFLVDDEGNEADGPGNEDHREEVQYDLVLVLRHTVRSWMEVIPKVGRNWKWSNEVLKSEISIFWCISMPNNVKSYKKIDEKAQTAKITVFAMGSQLLGAENMEN